MATSRKLLTGPVEDRTNYVPLLRLLLVNIVAAAGLVALWAFGFLELILTADHTRISLVIFAILVGTTLHCFYQTIVVSRELIAARRVKQILEAESVVGLVAKPDGVTTALGSPLPEGVFATHISTLVRKGVLQGGGRVDQSLLLRLLADRLRGRERLGLFISEALLRLALLGTAIGFILMLIPISALTSFETETLRGALGGMTSGMAIALNVTVTGIASALLLKLDYFLLNAAMVDLFDTIAETTEIYVVSALERDADARS
ncbi:MotA/TolQ/ExbB proton channel family protein [Devosia sp. A449]